MFNALFYHWVDNTLLQFLRIFYANHLWHSTQAVPGWTASRNNHRMLRRFWQRPEHDSTRHCCMPRLPWESLLDISRNAKQPCITKSRSPYTTSDLRQNNSSSSISDVTSTKLDVSVSPSVAHVRHNYHSVIWRHTLHIHWPNAANTESPLIDIALPFCHIPQFFSINFNQRCNKSLTRLQQF